MQPNPEHPSSKAYFVNGSKVTREAYEDAKRQQSPGFSMEEELTFPIQIPPDAERKIKRELIRCILQGKPCPMPFPLVAGRFLEFTIRPGWEPLQHTVNGHFVTEAQFKAAEEWLEAVAPEAAPRRVCTVVPRFPGDLIGERKTSAVNGNAYFFIFLSQPHAPQSQD